MLQGAITLGPARRPAVERDEHTDELHETATISDALWLELAEQWDTRQLLDLLMLAGWYHLIAYVANGAHVQPEERAGRFGHAR